MSDPIIFLNTSIRYYNNETYTHHRLNERMYNHGTHLQLKKRKNLP